MNTKGKMLRNVKFVVYAIFKFCGMCKQQTLILGSMSVFLKKSMFMIVKFEVIKVLFNCICTNIINRYSIK